MQRKNIAAGGRPRSRTYPSIPSMSYSKNPTKANLGGNEDDVDKLTTTRAIGYYDNSNVKFANQGEEENLVGVMDRLRAAKSRAKVDRNQETMRLRKDCWILESQRKAMLNSTVAFSDLLRSTRLKNARAAAQAVSVVYGLLSFFLTKPYTLKKDSTFRSTFDQPVFTLSLCF